MRARCFGIGSPRHGSSGAARPQEDSRAQGASRWLSKLAAASLIPSLVLVACTSPAPRLPVAGSGQGRAAATEDAQQYIIGPGDALRILVLRNVDLNADVTVRPDGRISTPLVNDVVAVGKTPTQLAREIETALAQYVRGPSVSVIVSQPTSRFSQVKVVGQAVSPKAFSASCSISYYSA